jgi:hypothetical protein
MFALKLYWFVNAFSLSEAGVTQAGVTALHYFQTEIAEATSKVTMVIFVKFFAAIVL